MRLLLFNILQRIFCFLICSLNVFIARLWHTVTVWVLSLVVQYSSTIKTLSIPVPLCIIQPKVKPTGQYPRSLFLFCCAVYICIYIWLTRKTIAIAWCLFLLLWLLTSLQAHQFGEFIRASCIVCVFTCLSTPPFNIVTFVFVDRVKKMCPQ